jgi:malate dehydrogenase
MPFAAIVGAGELGAGIAARLAARDVIPEVRLIDTASQAAAGKALDIQQSGAIEGFRTRVVSDGSVHAAAGARVVVLADSSTGQKEWQGDEGLAVLRQIWRSVEREKATIVCAGGLQRLLIERAATELRVDPGRICGSAPGALESAARALTALEVDGSPDDVRLSVTGIPPRGIVIPWSAATVRGVGAVQAIAPHRLTAITSHLAALWPPGPYALASSATRVVEALFQGSRRSRVCFVVLDGTLGSRGRVAALPVTLTDSGIGEIVAPSMTTHERVALENAIEKDV